MTMGIKEKIWVGITVMVVSGCQQYKSAQTSIPAEVPVKKEMLPFQVLRNASDLDILIDRIGSSHFVLLGEASHGTSEFQTWRAEISKRLIKEKDFNVIVVEGDFDEFISINEFIHADAGSNDLAQGELTKLKRWPMWMWQTKEFALFLEDIQSLNRTRKDKVNIYGMDLYGIGTSIEAIQTRVHDSVAAIKIREAKSCYQRFWDSALSYSTAVHDKVANCSAEMQNLKKIIDRIKKLDNRNEDFLLQQYMQTAFNGERYFRTIVYNQATSWNIRDQHFLETIERLVQLHGKKTKLIVWAHNSHVGDAAFTDMTQRGRTNLGELLRRKYGEADVFLVGFGMYMGSVLAAEKWNNIQHIYTLPPAYKGSWEEFLHRLGEGDKLIFSEDIRKTVAYNHWYDQRAVGVLYHPDRPRSSYVPSFVSKRYNAFIFIDSSHATHPAIRDESAANDRR